MCHVSDPCASSPQPLDQTVIRWMVEMEWSCASLHYLKSLDSFTITENPRFICKAFVRYDWTIYVLMNLHLIYVLHLCLFSSVV